MGSGIMSTVKSPALVPDQDGFEMDMRHLLRGRKEGASASVLPQSEGNTELTSLISQISLQSVQDIDHLIAGLQGIRQKLEDDSSRLQRQTEGAADLRVLRRNRPVQLFRSPQ